MSPEVLSDLPKGAQQDSPLQGKWDGSWEYLASAVYSVHSVATHGWSGGSMKPSWCPWGPQSSVLSYPCPRTPDTTVISRVHWPCEMENARPGERALKGGQNRRADRHVRMNGKAGLLDGKETPQRMDFMCWENNTEVYCSQGDHKQDTGSRTDPKQDTRFETTSKNEWSRIFRIGTVPPVSSGLFFFHFILFFLSSFLFFILFF